MPSGGARARSGPAPDPNALRRDRKDDKAEWTILPAEGRKGDPPPWPLVGQTEREIEIWLRYWAKPQAIIWERDHLAEVVALFVRQFCEGEVPKASAENRKTVRMMFADLYLTPDSMARAKLRIEPAGIKPEASRRPARSSSRSRLTVVSNDE